MTPSPKNAHDPPLQKELGSQKRSFAVFSENAASFMKTKLNIKVFGTQPIYDEKRLRYIFGTRRLLSRKKMVKRAPKPLFTDFFI